MSEIINQPIMTVLVKLAVVAAVLALILIIPLLVFGIGYIFFNLIVLILDWLFNVLPEEIEERARERERRKKYGDLGRRKGR